MRTKRSQSQQVEQYVRHCKEIGETPKVREIDLGASTQSLDGDSAESPHEAAGSGSGAEAEAAGSGL